MIRIFANRWRRPLQIFAAAENAKANAVGGIYGLKKREVSASANNEKPSATASIQNRQQTIESVKPYSAIPSDNRHWIINVLQILFTNGGIHKSLYKIHKEVLR